MAAGVFEHLLNRGPECPKVLGATHFHGEMSAKKIASPVLIHSEIFESGFLPARSTLGFAHMEVRVDTAATQAEKQVTCLYK